MNFRRFFHQRLRNDRPSWTRLLEAGHVKRIPRDGGGTSYKRTVDINPDQMLYISKDIARFMQNEIPQGLWKDFLFWLQSDGVLEASKQLDHIAKELGVEWYELMHMLNDPKEKDKIEKMFNSPEYVILHSSGSGGGKSSAYFVPLRKTDHYGVPNGEPLIDMLNVVRDINMQGDTSTHTGADPANPDRSNLGGFHTGDVFTYYNPETEKTHTMGSGYMPLKSRDYLGTLINQWVSHSSHAVDSHLKQHGKTNKNYKYDIVNVDLPDYIHPHRVEKVVDGKNELHGIQGNFSNIKKIKPSAISKPIDINKLLAKGWSWGAKEIRKKIKDPITGKIVRKRVYDDDSQSDMRTMNKGSRTITIKRDKTGRWRMLDDNILFKKDGKNLALNAAVMQDIPEDSKNKIGSNIINPVLIPGGQYTKIDGDGKEETIEFGGWRPNSDSNEQYPVPHDGQRSMWDIIDPNQKNELTDIIIKYAKAAFKRDDRLKKKGLDLDDLVNDVYTRMGSSFLRHKSMSGDIDMSWFKKKVGNEIQNSINRMRNKQTQFSAISSGEEGSSYDPADVGGGGIGGDKKQKGKKKDIKQPIQSHYEKYDEIRHNAQSFGIKLWAKYLASDYYEFEESPYLKQEPPEFESRGQARQWLSDPKNFDIDQLVEDQMEDRSKSWGLPEELFHFLTHNRDRWSAPQGVARFEKKTDLSHYVNREIRKNYAATLNMIKEKTIIELVNNEKFSEMIIDLEDENPEMANTFKIAIVNSAIHDLESGDPKIYHSIRHDDLMSKLNSLLGDWDIPGGSWKEIAREAVKRGYMRAWRGYTKAKQSTQQEQQPTKQPLPQPDMTLTKVPPPKPVPPSAATGTFGKNENYSFKDFVKKRMDELVGTFAVSPKKPGKKDTYNIWGTPGLPGGKVIEGDPIKGKK